MIAHLRGSACRGFTAGVQAAEGGAIGVETGLIATPG